MEKSEYYRMYELETGFWWYKVLHELVDDSIRRHLNGNKLYILDAGCGTGRMIEICRKYGTVYGIDFSEIAVKLAKSRGLQNIEVADLNDYQLNRETYDAILSLDVLYHSGIRDDQAILENFFPALKKNGILVLNLPAFEYLRRAHDEVVFTKKRYRKKELVKQLKKIGFTNIQATYRMPHLYLIILLSNLLHKNNGSWKPKSDLKKLPSWLNKTLHFCGRIENRWLNCGFGIPFGSSLFVIARKNN